MHGNRLKASGVVFSHCTLAVRSLLKKLRTRTWHDSDGPIVCVSVLFSSALIGVATLLLVPAYQSGGDDFAMRAIASGMRTGQPSEHLIFIDIALGTILKRLYDLWPDVFWYDWMLYLALLLAGSTATFAFMRRGARIVM